MSAGEDTDGQLNQESQLDIKRQTKYFLRCLKTYLPHLYTSNDSTRIGLAFFIVAALDLLDQLTENTTPKERADYIDWVYSNQHPNGGFRASPGLDLTALRDTENADWDPAHVPGTYFALCLLLILDDDFSRLKRRECLDWLVKLQRPDGSFGETLVHGTIQGGSDSRFGYCATGIRYMLAGHKPPAGQPNIDVDSLVERIRAAEAYDGGISDDQYLESHAGLTYCGLATLSFLDRLDTTAHRPSGGTTGPTDPEATIRWLVSRQTATITEDKMPLTSHSKTPERCSVPHWTGLNGRCNKVADTCYAFWVGGALHILGHPSLLHEPSLRKWLLERTAHPALGGFGKFAGELPDVYHSYLALAILSLMEVPEDRLQPLDATMCISTRAKSRLAVLWKRWGVSQETNENS